MANIFDRLFRSRCMNSKPLWTIFRQGTSTSVAWAEHVANRRFAIYDPGGNSNISNTATLSDDLVLDRETGLVWARDANLIGQRNWLDANTLCRELVLGYRAGWRLPSVEELSSLVDPAQQDPALPPGHPFVNVQYGSGVPAYWTNTNHENPSGAAWFVNFWTGAAPHHTGLGSKTLMGHIWPVRGGTGGCNWNW